MKNTGGNDRAKSRIQLVNGFSDVLETIDEVMEAVKNDNLFGETGAVFDDISACTASALAWSAGLQ